MLFPNFIWLSLSYKFFITPNLSLFAYFRGFSLIKNKANSITYQPFSILQGCPKKRKFQKPKTTSLCAPPFLRVKKTPRCATQFQRQHINTSIHKDLITPNHIEKVPVHSTIRPTKRPGNQLKPKSCRTHAHRQDIH